MLNGGRDVVRVPFIPEGYLLQLKVFYTVSVPYKGSYSPTSPLSYPRQSFSDCTTDVQSLRWSLFRVS